MLINRDMIDQMIFANKGQSQMPLTLSGLMDAAAKMEKICGSRPTDDQNRWAAENGFIRWDGIKVSIALYDLLKANSTRHADILIEVFCSRPLIIDGSLLPGEWLLCEAAWKQAHDRPPRSAVE